MGAQDRDSGARRRAAGTIRPRAVIWAARLAALVLAPLLFLAVVEGGLRLVGSGHPTAYFIRSADGEHLEANPWFGWRFFGADLSRMPTPTRIDARKPEGVYRIFVLGASAARGEPNPAFSFGRVLETMLAARRPDLRFEVVNTAMTAVNSHVVRHVARECAGLEPDLFVVYMGNNEVVGPYGAGSAVRGFLGSRRAVDASVRLRGTRTGQLLTAAGRAVAARRDDVRREWGGLEMFREQLVTADDPRLERVYGNYAANLEDILAVAREAGAPVILSTVLTNLRDQPPLASVHRDDLDEAGRERWRALFEAGESLAAEGDAAGALQRYLAAAALDDRRADLHFRMGEAYLVQGRTEDAARAFVLARDLDALRFRADSRINEIVRRVGEAGAGAGVRLVDVAADVRYPGPPPQPIPGGELLYEHVHMNFVGNYLVAAELYAAVRDLLPPAPRAAGNDAPPGIAECAASLVYTPYDQCADAVKIARITAKPPFAPEQGERDAARAARLEAELNEDILARSENDYRRALSARPADLLLRADYADLLSSRGRFADAAREFEGLLAVYPRSSDWLVKLGDVLRELGRDADAVDRYRRALDINGTRVDALVGRAVSLGRLGRADEAESDLRRALDIRPADAGANFELGRLELGRGEAADARDHFLVALRKQPDTPAFFRHLGAAMARAAAPPPEPILLRDVRIADLLLFLEVRAGVPVAGDWPALAAVGVTPETRVDCPVLEPGIERTLEAAARAIGPEALLRRSDGGYLFTAGGGGIPESGP